MKWINALDKLPEFTIEKPSFAAKYMGYYGNCYATTLSPKSIQFYGLNWKGYVYADSFKDFYWLDDTESPHPCKDVQEAAKEYAGADWDKDGDHWVGYSPNGEYKAFLAGAEWMQGDAVKIKWLIKTVFMEAQKGGGYTDETEDYFYKLFKQQSV